MEGPPTSNIFQHVDFWKFPNSKAKSFNQPGDHLGVGYVSSKLGTYLMCTYMCTMVKIPDFGGGHGMMPLPFSLGNPSVNHLVLNGPSHISNQK